MALADIPGYGAYIEKRRMNEQAPLAELQQASGAIGLMAALEKQKKAKAYEDELAALGLNPTPEQLISVASRYAGPEKALDIHQKSLDRAATLAAQKEAAADRRDNQKALIDARYDTLAMQTANEDQKRALEARRITEKAEADRRHDATLRLLGTLKAPPAPSMTEIVDPANPARMLRIDARLYKGGSEGASGVIGVAGKEPATAKREEKESQGKELLKTELDNLREHYRVLNESRAIPSSERGAGSNAAAWVQGSAVGQLGGRIVGTKEQDARNQIQSGRLRIMNAIKNATGMSAQQLNSNVELKTWLDSLTSMTGSYESNIGIIDSIEQAFLKGKSGGGGGDAPPGVDAAVWGAMTPQERALWAK